MGKAAMGEEAAMKRPRSLFVARVLWAMSLPRSWALNFYCWAWEKVHPCRDPGCPVCAARRKHGR